MKILFAISILLLVAGCAGVGTDWGHVHGPQFICDDINHPNECRFGGDAGGHGDVGGVGESEGENEGEGEGESEGGEAEGE